MATQDVSLCVDSNIIQHVDAVRDLGITFDSELTMQQHVNTVTRACFHHIRHLEQIRRLFGKDVAAGLVSAFILSRLDYCNAVLTGLPKSTIAPLQRVQIQNATARLVARLGPRDHVTSTIRDLHWLPVQHRSPIAKVRHRKRGGGGRLVLPQNMGSTRMFALGGSEGQDRGHRYRGKRK